MKNECPNTKSGKHYLETKTVRVGEKYRNELGNDMYKTVKNVECQFCDYQFIDDTESGEERANKYLTVSDAAYEERIRNASWWERMGWGD